MCEFESDCEFNLKGEGMGEERCEVRGRSEGKGSVVGERVGVRVLRRDCAGEYVCDCGCDKSDGGKSRVPGTPSRGDVTRVKLGVAGKEKKAEKLFLHKAR